MNSHEIKVNGETMLAEISAMDNGYLYIVKDGKVIAFKVPPYGTMEIISFSGKVDRVETKTSVKI
jgi:hypothetical protein